MHDGDWVKIHYAIIGDNSAFIHKLYQNNRMVFDQIIPLPESLEEFEDEESIGLWPLMNWGTLYNPVEHTFHKYENNKLMGHFYAVAFSPSVFFKYLSETYRLDIHLISIYQDGSVIRDTYLNEV